MKKLSKELAPSDNGSIDLDAEFRASNIKEVLDKLDLELIGLKPVKTRIRETAALLLVDRVRKKLDLTAGAPSLHMCFTGNPGTGKTTVALRMSEILHRLGYVREGHLVSVTRDDLVGHYIGHTAPKTKEVLKKAMGGVLFIDEAYYLYKPENERDYGAESIEILLQAMENNREDLVVILAGYKDRMDKFFHSNPEGENAFGEYIRLRMKLEHFANARSIRNALDRARLRQANRLFGGAKKNLSRTDLMTIEAEDIRASRVFKEGAVDLDGDEGANQIPPAN